MDLQTYLTNEFQNWQPLSPVVEGKSKCDVTLSWSVEPFQFLKGDLLFRVEKKEKLPRWVVVYSGGKTSKTIDNLPPRHPHTFRLKIILKVTAVSSLAEKALKVFGDEKNVYRHFEDFYSGKDTPTDKQETNMIGDIFTSDKQINISKDVIGYTLTPKDYKDQITDSTQIIPAIADNGSGDKPKKLNRNERFFRLPQEKDNPWIESLWSEEMSTSTDTDGTSAICFCMAVRCGYLKQMQAMLEEKPALIEIINSKNGFTPLATAVRKGDITTVKFLLAANADVDQVSTTGQTPLHLAVQAANIAMADLLLEKGADFKICDLNGLRVEHYAVDSGNVEMLTFVLELGGDVTVRDNNGWTPLFRAVTQGASTAIIELLVNYGSDVESKDYAGLALTSAARLLKNRHGRSRDSILRLVDTQFPHEVALANFTRLTKKISSINTILK